MSENNLPLSRFKVLDLTTARSGPTAVKQLADWGADVIKIEPSRKIIASGGGLSRDRHGYEMQNLHRNKRGMTLNLKSEEGREIFYNLVKNSDVVIENYRPDVKNRLKIDYETLKSINKKIILGSISGFGQFGPYSSRPGLDQIAQGLSGLMSVTGMPENGPTRVGVPIGDLTAGMMLAQGVLLALLEREKSGEGQWVHTSLLEGLIQIMDLQAARFLMAGEVPKQVGNLHPVYLPTGVFPTSDSSMNIQSPGQVFWKRLSAALGKPELFEDEDFKTPEDRWNNKDRLNKEISELTMQKTTAEWVEILNDAGVPCGPIHSVNETFADPQVQQLNMNPELEHPVIGKINVVGQAIKLSRTPQKMRFTTPEVGEHNEQILSELNYSEEDIEKFKQEDII
tara:strand:+ start:39262 stop:40452 length:1191 start_codon:yes stop_codon:yes gene_type:complete